MSAKIIDFFEAKKRLRDFYLTEFSDDDEFWCHGCETVFSLSNGFDEQSFKDWQDTGFCITCIMKARGV